MMFSNGVNGTIRRIGSTNYVDIIMQQNINNNDKDSIKTTLIRILQTKNFEIVDINPIDNNIDYCNVAILNPLNGTSRASRSSGEEVDPITFFTKNEYDEVLSRSSEHVTFHLLCLDKTIQQIYKMVEKLYNKEKEVLKSKEETKNIVGKIVYVKIGDVSDDESKDIYLESNKLNELISKIETKFEISGKKIQNLCFY